MKQLFKINFIFIALFFILLMSSCTKEEKVKTPAETPAVQKTIQNKENKTEEKDEAKKVDKNKKEKTEKSEEVKDEVQSDENKALEIINSYVAAAKKLDFEAMNKFITDNNELPILESYKQAYAPYSISEERIEELCKARLGTYKIKAGAAVKNGDDIIATVSISMVNMESLQNKWMENLCNKYPEYTTLADDEMTPEVVDVLIQTMIDVLKESSPSVDVKKEFKLTRSGDSWIINAKNEDFFPSN